MSAGELRLRTGNECTGWANNGAKRAILERRVARRACHWRALAQARVVITSSRIVLASLRRRHIGHWPAMDTVEC